MKKERIQTIFLSLIVFVSFSSFAYLNFVAKPNLEVAQAELILEEDKQPESEIFMPDLELANRIFKLAKVVFVAQ